jgi:prevent-host-death family protein
LIEVVMVEIELKQAQAELSAMLDRVECGETLTLTRDGKPVARIVPIAQRRPGLLKGQIGMAPDFDAMPEWLVEAFEGNLSDELLLDPPDSQLKKGALHAGSVWSS